MKIGISLPVRELKNDLAAIKAFAQTADELGFSHLRVPEQILRPESGYLHEPLTLLAYVAALTRSIQLVPSVIVLPSRRTVLFAKQAAELDVLSGGRLRLGIGVGASPEEYRAMGVDFQTRGARCEEQLELLKQLWTRTTVDFQGRWDRVSGVGLDPLPVQRSIPVWIGPNSRPIARIRRRIGRQADGWFVLCPPEEFPAVQADIQHHARAAGRDPHAIGTEAGVAVVGPRQAEWRDRVSGWRRAGLSHLCLRTLGGGLDAQGHIDTMQQALGQLPDD